MTVKCGCHNEEWKSSQDCFSHQEHILITETWPYFTTIIGPINREMSTITQTPAHTDPPVQSAFLRLGINKLSSKFDNAPKAGGFRFKVVED